MAWAVNNDPDQIVLFAGGQLSLSRYATDLKAAGGMYYTIPPISLTDFEIEFEIATTQTANKILMGDSNLTSYYFNYGDTGVSCLIAGTERSHTVTAGSLTDGKLHSIAWSLVGTTLKLFIDGALKQTWTGVASYTGVNNFRIGSSNSLTTYLSGSFFSTKIWSGGNRNTGALVRDYRFNDNDGILVDYSGNNANGASVNVTAADRELMTLDAGRNAWVGGELWLNSSVQYLPERVSFDAQANSYTKLTDSWGSFGFLSGAPIQSNSKYLVRFEVEGYINSPSGFSIYTRNSTDTDNSPLYSVTGDGEHEVIVKSGLRGLWFDGSGQLGLKVSSISFKRIIEVAQ